jgi:hypothetical protein
MQTHWIYYVFMVIGILTVGYVVWQLKQRRNIEGFDDPVAGGTGATGGATDTTGGAAGTGSGGGTGATGGAGATGDGGAGGTGATTTPEIYIENISSLPKASSIRYYLTSFSDNTNYGHKSYVPEEMRWYNYIEDVSFNLVGRLPNDIRRVLTGETAVSPIGLPIKAVKLIGPASSRATCSAAVGGASVQDLGAFTVSFFGRMNALDLNDTNRSIVLFQMFAENPNHIRWSLTHRDAANCYIEVVLGNVNTTYRWLVPKSTVLSNGNATLYTLVYSVFDVKRTITVYIGTNKYVASSTDMTPIRMGNTPMEINSSSNLDMILQAFFYANTAFAEADLPTWTEYFINESGGLSRTLKFLKDTYATEINTLSSQLANQTNSVEDLQQLLDACRAKLPPLAGLEEKKDKWKIKMEGDADISTEDAKSCTILKASSPWKKPENKKTDDKKADDKKSKDEKEAADETNEEEESALKVVSPLPK